MAQDNPINNILRLAIDTTLPLILLSIKILNATNKALGAALDTYIKILEDEMKSTKEKVKIE